MSASGKFFYICIRMLYSLACHAGVKVSIPGSIHKVLARKQGEYNVLSCHGSL